jgi:hypothetical protein
MAWASLLAGPGLQQALASSFARWPVLPNNQEGSHEYSSVAHVAQRPQCRHRRHTVGR